MNLIVRQPSKILSEYVKCFWILEADNIKHQELVYPTGESQMMFHYREPFTSIKPGGKKEKQPRIFMSGLNTSYRIIEVDQPCGMVGVSFYPYALKAFLPFSLKEITDLDLHLADAFPKLKYLECEIENCSDNEERIGVVEQFLISRLDPNSTAHYFHVKDIVNLIETSRGLLKIESILKNNPFSERQLERLFNSHIGIPPQKFIEITRFHGSVMMINSPLDLTEIAYESGFYDQSHFIKSFKKYTGLTPGEFRSKYSGCEIN